MFFGSLDPVSNRETWTVVINIVDQDGDIDLDDLDEATVELFTQSGVSVLSGTLTGGEVTVVEDGVLSWTFTSTQMRTLSPQTYNVGCLLEQNDEERQLIIGTLPVLDGYIT